MSIVEDVAKRIMQNSTNTDKLYDLRDNQSLGGIVVQEYTRCSIPLARAVEG